MNEIWVPIKGHEDEYEVSNLGNVRGKDRYVDYRINKETGRFAKYDEEYIIKKRFLKGKYIKPLKSSNGYTYVWIKGKNHYLHRVVASHFLVDETGNYELVEHLNHDKADNRVVNLKWSNQSDNIRRSVKDGIWNNQWTKIK